MFTNSYRENDESPSWIANDAVVLSSENDINGINIGSDVMLGDIGFQLGVSVFYAILRCEFLLRYKYDRPFTRHRNRNVSSTTLPSPN
ncbi:uncharacterized protein BT62DRAFT_1010545 [Guyanagaster necrorhizus]|uniref:Uncharacterized protein n=1 Tax=Guyanagaster necrorhizus TaxID=856835 RepID=A0A9P8ANG0_9AGAR|nr:uncharacterized protein BT62DRAFT_1010545 [Guyanagaster necrorhizus MCA 3950]KAG7442278.1 hypothetical protein BT62DRAFT_1010545 [Guyanagaster necrorhizus MCA 3950]